MCHLWPKHNPLGKFNVMMLCCTCQITFATNTLNFCYLPTLLLDRHVLQISIKIGPTMMKWQQFYILKVSYFSVLLVHFKLSWFSFDHMFFNLFNYMFFSLHWCADTPWRQLDSILKTFNTVLNGLLHIFQKSTLITLLEKSYIV